MDPTLRKRVLILEDAIRKLGALLVIAGWQPGVNDVARKIKRQDQLGPLVNELRGWEELQVLIPGTKVNVSRPIQGQPVAVDVAVVVAEIRPLLDILIQAGERYAESRESCANAGFMSLPQSGIEREEAKKIASRLISIADFLKSAVSIEPIGEVGGNTDQMSWAYQVELRRATEQVLGGDGKVDKGYLSRECNGKGAKKNPRIEIRQDDGGSPLVQVDSFLVWLKQVRSLPDDEVIQVRNAIMGEILAR